MNPEDVAYLKVPRKYTLVLDKMAEEEGLTSKGRWSDMARIILKKAVESAEGAQ